MVFIVVCILAAVAYIAFKIGKYEPQIKGAKEELRVAHILSRLSEDQYKVLNNILLKTQFGTTQIDHLVISVYGIFVIETKNYSGWIMGGEHSEQWIKNMYGKKYYFRNPIKQNRAHIRALQEILQLPSNKFISIVVFSGRSTIKVNTGQHVIYTGELIRTIKIYDEILFTNHEVDRMILSIQKNSSDSKDDRAEHVKQIQKRVQYNKSQVQNGICPRCGGALVLRSGRYGEFYGCSNYPKCRYTITI